MGYKRCPDTPLDLLVECESLVKDWDTYELGGVDACYPHAQVLHVEGENVAYVPAQWVVHCLREYNRREVAMTSIKEILTGRE